MGEWSIFIRHEEAGRATSRCLPLPVEPGSPSEIRKKTMHSSISSTRKREVRITALTAVLGALCLAASPAAGQLSEEDLAALRRQGEREGWTFTVGPSSATERPLSELCGLVIPKDWRQRGPWDACEPRGELPEAFDWRALGGCTPIRNQDGCGSCWAFGAVGAVECSILIKTGESVDLSEQWLVSCTDAGSCSGGWHTDALEYMLRAGWKDYCGDSGAVLESDFPYEAWDKPCGCPYPHPRWIDLWAYIGTSWGVPTVDQIKQAIVDRGPVAVGVYVNSAFQGYSGGVFNGCKDKQINHIVDLVGWDDNMGSDGVWILRNSWGKGWGEDGYMYIPYGCSKVGFVATYADCCTAPVVETVTCEPNPVKRGELLRLTAGGVTDPSGDEDVAYVAFYLDANGNCEVDSSDTLLGTDDSAEGGWELAVDAGKLPLGDQQILAGAKDYESMWGIPACCGVEVLDYTGLMGVSAWYFASEEAVKHDLNTVDVFAVFDDPTGEVVEVSAEIEVTMPFYQHELGGDTAPPEEALGADPLVISDSFVTIGVVKDDGSDGTTLLGDFDSDAFNMSGQVTGSWDCQEPGQAVAKNNPFKAVRLARLTFPSEVESVGGSVSVQWVRDGGGDTTAAAFVAESEIDCNFNGILDSEELIDCNGNGLLDECDIAYGYSSDVNENGIPDECDCPADVTGDWMVDVLDLLAVLGSWQQTDVPEDINGDGIVDVLDLLELLGAWGPCE